MGKLTWQSYGENFYEHGVDRVVAYPEGGAGAAWAGVTTISEKNDATVDGYYLDGLKYVQVPSYGEYGASLEAYSIPSGLNLCLGFTQLSPGLFATNQRRRSFSLSYRTLVGNEDGDRIAYKLHLVYNAVATPSFGERATIKDAPEPTTHSLELSTMPPEDSVPNLRPTAHLILDSRYVPSDVMEDIERILYGTEILEPRLPLPNEILMLTQAPAYTVSWDGASNASASRLVRRTSELVARNLATNPGFEATSGTVEVRRNLAPNPVSAVSPLTISQDGSVGSVARSTAWFHRGPASTLLTRGTGWTYAVASPHTVMSNSGATLYFGAWVMVPMGNPATSVDVTTRGTVGFSAATTTLTPGVPKWITRAVTSSEAGQTVQFEVGWEPVRGAQGWQVYISDIQTSTTPLDPEGGFDGSFSPDSDLTPSWTGTANASASVLSGVGVAGSSNSAGRIGFSSQAWSSSGSRSIRVLPRAVNNDTFVSVHPMIPSVAVMAGKTYTVLGRVRLAEAQTGTLHSYARAFRASTLPGDAPVDFAYLSSAPNEPGIHEVRATFTVPANATAWGFFRLYNGAGQGSGDVWWDDLAIIEGNYTGKWFDGNNLPDS